MQVIAKRSLIYRGKLYRKGEAVEVDKADASRDLFTASEVVMTPDQIDEPSEPTTLPPLEPKRKKS